MRAALTTLATRLVAIVQRPQPFASVMSDELIARIREHDKQALAEFIAGHRPQLMAFIERQLGTALRRKIEPDDVYQEASAEAIRALPTAEHGDRDPFS